jgi:adenine-specific DNA-methyltransferase
MPRKKRQPARKTPKAAKPPPRKKTPRKPHASKQSPSSKRSAVAAKTKRPNKATAAKPTVRSTKTRSNAATTPTSNRRFQTRKPMNPSNPIKQPHAQTEGSSANIVELNIAKLRTLFPDAFTEGTTASGPRFKVDFEALKQILGAYTDDEPERYSFTWNGKARARRMAQTPSSGTLLPRQDDSVNWDKTENLFIEGDNLEVLKLLQKSYHRQVKLIYIDPPYNTGNEFIYPDKFQDNLDTYLRYTGQTTEEGLKLSANAESSGRYHTNWLNMMLPRLMVAKHLLKDDGVIFISIDDHEVSRLRYLCDEVFGEENFLATLIWQKVFSPKNTAQYFSEDHDFILAYARNKEAWTPQLLTRSEEAVARYTNPDNDPRGDWTSSDLTARNYYGDGQYEVVGKTGKTFGPGRGRYWRQSLEKFKELDADGRLWWGEDGANMPRLKRFLTEVKDGVVPQTLLLHTAVGNTQEAKKELLAFAEFSETENVLNSVKPTRLLRHLLKIGTAPAAGDIVLDFFAGSGPMGHSVLAQNADDGGNRRFILVQLPEPLPKPEAKVKTIADIATSRLRNVAKSLESANEQAARDNSERLISDGPTATVQDLGFRLFKLSSSNIKPWDADFDTLEQAIYESAENIKSDRSEQDVLYELLLKYGLNLCVPIEERTIAGKTVFSVGAGALMVCLDKKITLDVVEGIAKLKDELKPEVMRVVFRDSGFKDDVVKTNAVQILKQVGLSDEHIRSI